MAKFLVIYYNIRKIILIFRKNYFDIQPPYVSGNGRRY